MNGLDLFSGIGGIGLALKPWVRTVAYCEQDRYAQAVLMSRMREGKLDRAPIWDDVRTLRGDMLPRIDIVFGGFPCQDISVAGAGRGLAGERSGLVFDLLRIVGECRPSFVFLENVPALAVRGLDQVLLGLHALGFDARWTIVSAAEVGAPHLRERIWIMANARGGRCLQPEGREMELPRRAEAERASDLPDAKGVRLETERQPSGTGEEKSRAGSHCDRRWGWATEPAVGRVVDGISPELDFFIYRNEELDVSCLETNTEEAESAANLFNREVLRKMWEYRETATSSSEIYFRRLSDSVPGLPCKATHRGENLGQRIQKGSELYGLWHGFYSASEQVEQAMWQSRLLERIWQIKCDETMARANRVDRIKCLGNSVCPQAAREAFKRLAGIV